MSRGRVVSSAGAGRRPWRRLGRRLAEEFPEVGGNRVQVLDLGPRYFRAMLAALDGARATIDVEMYLWDDDVVGRRFCEALARAAARGVRVRVLADAYGARAAIRGPLVATAAAGADVRVFNPFRLSLSRRLYHRTHKKLLVTDGGRAFCGGAGFSLYFSGWKHRERPWHDRMFEIEGPVVEQLTTTFETDFGRWSPSGTAPPAPVAQRRGERPAAVGRAVARVLRGFPDGRDFPTEVVRALESARERIWIGTPYLLPPRRLRRALRRALAGGVDVRIIVPSLVGSHPVLWYASRRHYGWLLRRGARIFEFGPAFYHAKIAVQDTAAAFVGSSNLDPLSWRQNAELDLLFTDPATVAMMATLFGRDESGAAEVDLALHRSRGVVSRLKEWIVSWFEDWM